MANEIHFKDSEVHSGAILVGSMIGVFCQILLTLIGVTIGFMAIEVEKKGITTAAGVAATGFAVLSIFLSFYVGGYAAVRLSRPLARGVAMLHGIAVCATIAIFTLIFVGSPAASSLGGLLSQAGLGVGAATGMSTMLEEIKRIHPYLISDVSLFKGKIVTELRTGELEASNLAGTVGKEAKKLRREAKSELRKPKVKAETQEAAETVRHVAAGTSFVAVIALIIGVLASTLGATMGRRGPPPSGSLRDSARRAA